MNKMLFSLFMTAALAGFSANAKDSKDKKDRAPAAPPVLGMPMPHGSGMPPGAVGLPMPRDGACRRAAGMGAVAEALDELGHQMDCETQLVSTQELNLDYHVDVTCENQSLSYEV